MINHYLSIPIPIRKNQVRSPATNPLSLQIDLRPHSLRAVRLILYLLFQKCSRTRSRLLRYRLCSPTRQPRSAARLVSALQKHMCARVQSLPSVMSYHQASTYETLFSHFPSSANLPQLRKCLQRSFCQNSTSRGTILRLKSAVASGPSASTTWMGA